MRSAEVVHRPVQPAVEHQELLDVLGRLDPLLHRRHRVDVLIGQSRRGLGQRQRLQPFADLVAEVVLAHVHRRHPGALVGPQRDQAARLQDARRLPDRQPAGVELVGQLVLDDPGAGGQPPGQDPLAQLVGDALAGHAGGYGHGWGSLQSNASGWCSKAFPLG
jgi:hypothetical protein